MKSFLLISSALLVLSVYCINSADGLECYFCGYAEGLEMSGENVDKSCMDGKKPNKKYKQTCGSAFNSCGKLFYKGKFAGEDIKVTIRGCLSANDAKCKSDNAPAIVADPSTPADIRTSLVGLPASIDATYCTCTGDNCNSGSMLQVTQGLLLVSFSFLASKFAGIA